MKMITSFTIENFRGIKKLNLNNLGQINVIAGKNNAGKSSVLEALFLALAGVNQGNDILRDALRKVLTWRGWFGKNSITSLFYEGCCYATRVKFLANDTPFAIELKEHGDLFKLLGGGLKLDEDSMRRVGLGKLLIIPINAQAGVLRKEHYALINVDFPEGGELVTIFSTGDDFPVRMPTRFITPFDVISHGFVEKAHSWAFKEKGITKAFSIIREGYPEFQNLSPLPEGNSSVMYVDTAWSKRAIPYYTMGDGFKTLVAFALVISSLSKGYLLIDSAEAFHHPQSLRVMAKTLVRGAKENNVQVFLTTHSLELIDLLIKYGLESRVDGRVIYMKRENGNIKASTETFEESRELRETLGLDLRG
jgi:hypothetical protein